MTDKISNRAIIYGEAVAFWEVELPTRPTAMAPVSEELEDPNQVFSTVTLYRPVSIELDNSGEPFAYCYADHNNPQAKDGRIYFDARYIQMSPPTGSEPARKFGVDSPGEKIEYNDLPEEYRDE